MMIKTNSMRSSVLGTCLRNVRSLTTGCSTGPGVPGADFFGGIVRTLGIDAPHLEVRAPHRGDPALSFPPLEGVTDCDEPFDLLDFEELSNLRDAGVHNIPHPALIFGELLRCISSPQPGPEATLMSVGVLRADTLPSGYFRENADVSNDRATNTLRRSFFGLYGHILLRCLERRSAVLTRFLFDADNSSERVKRFGAVLRTCGASGEAHWDVVSGGAMLFVGALLYDKMYLASGRCTDPPTLDQGVAGAPTSLYHALYAQFFGKTPETTLPAPLAVLLGMTLDNRGSRTQLALFPGKLRQHAHVLSDERRIERIERMLAPEERASWLRVEFSRIEDRNGSTVPSLLVVSHASFCVALERLLEADLATIERAVCMASAPAMSANALPSPIQDSPLQRQIAALAAEIDLEYRALAGAKKRTTSGTRFARITLAQDLEFSTDGFATLTFPHARGAGRPLACRVQQGTDGPVPAGTIWVPIARHLVREKLGVELHVFHAEFDGSDGRYRLVPLPATVVDLFIVDDGALLCIELDATDNPTKPKSLAQGGFRTLASMRMTTAAAGEGEARLCCVIACFE
jgi:hypothetical protein